MKKLILFSTFMFFTIICFSQTKCFTEALVKQDSILTIKYNYAVENCEKSIARYRDQTGQSCPVFVDEQGFVFYVRVQKGKLEFIDL